MNNNKYLKGELVQEIIDEVKTRLGLKLDKSTVIYKPGGSWTFENLPALTSDKLGLVYTITNGFVTTSDFLEGEGLECEPGTEIAVVAYNDNYKYNIFGGNPIKKITSAELAYMWKDPGVLEIEYWFEDDTTNKYSVSAGETAFITDSSKMYSKCYIGIKEATSIGQGQTDLNESDISITIPDLSYEPIMPAPGQTPEYTESYSFYVYEGHYRFTFTKSETENNKSAKVSIEVNIPVNY